MDAAASTICNQFLDGPSQFIGYPSYFCFRTCKLSMRAHQPFVISFLVVPANSLGIRPISASELANYRCGRINHLLSVSWLFQPIHWLSDRFFQRSLQIIDAGASRICYLLG
jgi:hypothetical protein